MRIGMKTVAALVFTILVLIFAAGAGFTPPAREQCSRGGSSDLALQPDCHLVEAGATMLLNSIGTSTGAGQPLAIWTGVRYSVATALAATVGVDVVILPMRTREVHDEGKLGMRGRRRTPSHPLSSSNRLRGTAEQ